MYWLTRFSELSCGRRKSQKKTAAACIASEEEEEEVVEEKQRNLIKFLFFPAVWFLGILSAQFCTALKPAALVVAAAAVVVVKL